MAKISKEDVEHIARLASLKLPPDQLETYTKQFSSIIGYFEKLNSVDTSKVGITSHAIEGVVCPLREDADIKFETVDAILNILPQKSGRLLEVPKVIENE
jgi:aspartyl-tRNA(Asn)/glutamyl-tRNA(Gln) amidotransferase subunit C